MPRRMIGKDVFEAGVERMRVIFADGHRVVVSFSAGKDSGVALEVCLRAMREAGVGNGGLEKLDVVMRDEEIMYPGTFEYAERVAHRSEVDFHWVIANQPIVNVFNRAYPYFWVFDPALIPDQWVRRPPEGLPRPYYSIQQKAIQYISHSDRFPPPPGKKVYQVLGLRTSESSHRLLGIHSSGGYICLPSGRIGPDGGRDVMWGATPLYDWRDEDIWRAIHVEGWDYNSAYDAMNKMGVPKRSLRIAPPTMNQAGVEHLGVAARAWPSWFDAVCRRLKGVRTAAQFGKRAVYPHRRYGETWQDCFVRECITDAPAEWIRDRAAQLMGIMLARHAKHSSAPFPEKSKCKECVQNGCWKALALNMYNGDPFCLKTSSLKYMEPEFFREGSGTWGGNPTWAG